MLLYYLPYADVIVYPIRIFVTFIHEASHALAAWATGGSAASIGIEPTGNGVTMTRGGLSFLVSSSGYIGSTTYGVFLLRICRTPRLVNAAFLFTAAILGLTTFLLVRPILSFGFLAGIGLTFLMAAAAAILPRTWAQFLLAFLALECCLNALFDLKTLVQLSAATGVHTDAVNMELATGIPAIVWAFSWSAVSVVLILISLRGYLPNGGR